jgi:hypothetical protein
VIREHNFVPEKGICPICNRRRAERYCPAKGEKICAVDCGTEREITIDCPSTCAYLIAAHRWELEHSRPVERSEVSFLDVSIPTDWIHTRRESLSGLGYTVLAYAQQQRMLTDADVFAAVDAMAATSRTLVSGIYYEKPPDSAAARGLYAAIGRFIEEEKKRGAGRPELPALKDSEIFHLLVFFLRFGKLRSNGRTYTRGFLEFLRAQYPQEAGLAKEEPRIIMP